MLADLKRSLLTADDAKRLGFVPMAEKECESLNLSQSGDGFKIPYYDAAGNEIDTFRYRFFDTTSVVASGFAKGQTIKRPKYLQPGGKPPMVYFPHVADVDWSAVREDATVPLIITEGEKKSASVTKYVAPCIGLGGVYSFGQRKHGKMLIDDLERFKWEGREVYICYDSDAVDNKLVVTAEARLATILTGKLARVHVVRVPKLEGHDKLGIDDYIALKGAEEAQNLISESKEHTHLIEFHAINSECVYVANPSMVCVYPKDDHPENQPKYRMLNVQKFANEVFADKKYLAFDAAGKQVAKPAAKDWMQWEGRAIVDSVCYSPGDELIVNNNQLNVWEGWGVEPAKGDVSLFKELIDTMLEGADAGHKHWFMQWLAYPIQHPGTKMNTAVVVWSLMQGVGKSLLGYTMKGVYGSNWAEITNVELQDNRNSWAVNKQFVLGEEITAGATRESADLLKNMITGQTLSVDEKFVPRYTLKNCVNYYFTSNHPDAFFINAQDRRYFVHEIKVKASPEFFKKYDRWYKTREAAAAIHWFLAHYDLSGFNPQGEAPKTEAHQAMVSAGKSELGSFVERLQLEPDSLLVFSGIVNKRRLWKLEELHQLYMTESFKHKQVSQKALGLALREQGFMQPKEGQQLRLNDGSRARLWIVRPIDGIERMTEKQLADLYDADKNDPTGAKRDKAPKHPAKKGVKF
jgi:hypothetical protein